MKSDAQMINPIRHIHTWVRALSNAALIGEFEVAYKVYQQSGDTGCLDIIHDEIRRRESEGTLTDEDWKAERSPQI
jgi:hypothetical protein